MSLYVGVLKWGSPVVTRGFFQYSNCHPWRLDDDWYPPLDGNHLFRDAQNDPSVGANRSQGRKTVDLSGSDHFLPVDTRFFASSSIGWHHPKIGDPHSSGWSSCSPLKLIYVWAIPYFHHQSPSFTQKFRGSFAEGERHAPQIRLLIQKNPNDG